jgi:type I restriction enzyme S subunit
MAPRGAILFVVRGMSLAKEFRVGVAAKSLAFNQDVRALVPAAEIDPAYLVHCLRAHEPQILALVDHASHGTTRLTSDRYEAFELPVPPLSEQRRIAEVLDRAEVLRAKRRAALAHLDTLTQSIFLTLFGDPAVNDKSLPTSNLSDMCRRITDGTHQPPRWVPDGIPFLFISNIVDGQIDFRAQKYISEDTYQELSQRCPVELGDVLFTTVGSYGNAAVVQSERRFSFQRHIAHIKPDPAKVDSTFLAAMIQSPGVRRQVDRAAKGIAQKTVNLAELKKLVVFCPPMKAQRDFAAHVAAVDALKSAHRASLAKLFASLQHRAFRGEL